MLGKVPTLESGQGANIGSLASSEIRVGTPEAGNNPRRTGRVFGERPHPKKGYRHFLLRTFTLFSPTLLTASSKPSGCGGPTGTVVTSGDSLRGSPVTATPNRLGDRSTPVREG